MSKREVKQGDIYMGSLPDYAIDNEQMGDHPMIILSVDIRNKSNNNIVVCTITHSNKKYQPTHYYLLKNDYDFFLYPKNTVMTEDIHTISKNRLQRYMGTISNEDFKNILECKEYIFVEKEG